MHLTLSYSQKQMVCTLKILHKNIKIVSKKKNNPKFEESSNSRNKIFELKFYKAKLIYFSLNVCAP